MKLIAALILAGMTISLSSASLAQDAKRLINVKSNGYWGVLDENGTVIVPLEYDSIYIRDDGIISATKGVNEVYIDADGNLIWKGMRQIGNADRNGYLSFEGPNKLMGLMDRGGRQLLPAIYGYVHPFDGALNYVVHLNGRAGVINLEGKRLFPQTFFSISRLAANGLAIAKPNRDSYGVIDRTGAWIIEPGRFEQIWEFGDDGLASAKLGGKWGFIDRAGSWVIKPISEDILWLQPFNAMGTTAVKIGGKWGFIDRKGAIVVKPQFDEINYPIKGNYLVKIDGRFAIVDGRGRYLLKMKFSNVSDFSAEGLAVAWRGDKSFIINRKGRSVFGNRFEQVGGFDGGWAAAQSGGKWGAIDSRGRWIINPTYQCVSVCFDDPPPRIEIRELPQGG